MSSFIKKNVTTQLWKCQINYTKQPSDLSLSLSYSYLLAFFTEFPSNGWTRGSGFQKAAADCSFTPFSRVIRQYWAYFSIILQVAWQARTYERTENLLMQPFKELSFVCAKEAWEPGWTDRQFVACGQWKSRGCMGGNQHFKAWKIIIFAVHA